MSIIDTNLSTLSDMMSKVIGHPVAFETQRNGPDMMMHVTYHLEGLEMYRADGAVSKGRYITTVLDKAQEVLMCDKVRVAEQERRVLEERCKHLESKIKDLERFKTAYELNR